MLFEDKSQCFKQSFCMCVIFGSSDDSDLESHRGYDIIQWKFREDIVIRESDIEVSLSIKVFFRETGEVSQSRHHQFHESIKEIICSLFSQGCLKHDRYPFSELEVWDSFLWFEDTSFLSSDLGDCFFEFIEILEWFSRSQRTYSDSDNHFIDLWDSIDVFDAKLFLEVLEYLGIECF